MEINLFNAMNPNGLRVPVTVTLEHVVNKSPKDGELIFIITLSCGAYDVNKQRVNPVIINNVNQGDILKEIQRGLAILGESIDWNEDLPDEKAPVVTTVYPENGAEDVNFYANVEVTLQDKLPSSSIDPSSIRLYANSIEVNQSELEINQQTPREFKVTWKPKRVKA